MIDSLLPIIRQSIQHSCDFAYPENVFLIMLGDDNKATRAEAVNMIYEIEAHNHTSFQEFYHPRCNFNAKGYTEIVDIYEKERTAITYY